MLLAAPTSTLCPYTTLFRSGSADAAGPGEGTRDSGGGEPGLLGDVVDRHALGCHLRPSFDADVTTTVGSMLPEPTATGGNQGRPDSGGAGAHKGWPGASRQGEAPGLRATGPPGHRATGPPGHCAAGHHGRR